MELYTRRKAHVKAKLVINETNLILTINVNFIVIDARGDLLYWYMDENEKKKKHSEPFL